MIFHYLRTLLKILSKNSISSFINVLGLIVGMVSALLIAKYIGYSSTFDQNHRNRDEIFQISQTETKNGNIVYVGGLTYRGISINNLRSAPEVLNSTKFDQHVETLVLVNDQQQNTISFNENGIFSVDSSFLQLFDFQAIYGGVEGALTKPHSAIITQSISEKYFGDKNPIGETIETRVSWGENQNWKVTCVIQDPPKNSNIRFDILLAKTEEYEGLWDSPVFNQYVLVKKNTNIKELENRISSEISQMEIFKDENRNIRITLNPLKPSLSSIEILLIFVGLLILILSWINFTNLSIGQFIERQQEVFIRRSLGSSNGQLIQQYLFESASIVLTALILSLLILSVSYKSFLNITEGHLLPLIDNSFNINLSFTILFILGSLISSIYPIIRLVFKNKSKSSLIKNAGMGKSSFKRKLFVGIQFGVAISLMTFTYVISSQMDYLTNKKMGFNIENKIIIKPPKDSWNGKWKRLRTLKKEFYNLSWITSSTSSSTIPGQSYRQEGNFSLLGSNEKVLIYVNEVDKYFLKTYEINITHGSNFLSGGGPSNKHKALINGVASRLLGLSPEAAVGEKIFDGEREFTIIGVVENYHKTSPKEKIEPMLFGFNMSRGYITINVIPNATPDINLEKERIATLESIWNEIYPDQVFEYFILSSYYNDQFYVEQFLIKIFRFFTIIAAFLACFGLIALSFFESSNYKMEVGIRKTFGSSSGNIFMRFMSRYLLIFIISYVLTIPLTYYLLENWLYNYSYRITISLEHLILPSIILGLVALGSSGFKILQLSMINPGIIFRED